MNRTSAEHRCDSGRARSWSQRPSLAYIPGRATAPRISAPHMLPSAIVTASAPANSGISWLIPTPHTITVYASPWSSPPTAQHSLPGGRYPLPGPDFHRLDRASFAWRTANPSPPSGWIGDFHPQAIEHAGHTTERLRRRRAERSLIPRPLDILSCWAGRSCPLIDHERRRP